MFHLFITPDIIESIVILESRIYSTSRMYAHHVVQRLVL